MGSLNWFNKPTAAKKWFTLLRRSPSLSCTLRHSCDPLVGWSPACSAGSEQPWQCSGAGMHEVGPLSLVHLPPLQAPNCLHCPQRCTLGRLLHQMLKVDAQIKCLKYNFPNTKSTEWLVSVGPPFSPSWSGPSLPPLEHLCHVCPIPPSAMPALKFGKKTTPHSE